MADRNRDKPMNKLFVYGIFLDQDARVEYGMTNATYDTVEGYFTVGDYIVEAIPVPDRPDIKLTGLLVDVAQYTEGERGEVLDTWDRLDRLERAYDRITITTTSGKQAYMYVGKGE